jgi:hypothetical protein
MELKPYQQAVINDLSAYLAHIQETKDIRAVFHQFWSQHPDFIIQTKSGKTILLETKGDYLEAAQKTRLGALWANKAGNNFRYFMVYDKREVEGTYKLENFLELMRNM